jgi:F0F1-type ATP synthase assembly protein I
MNGVGRAAYFTLFAEVGVALFFTTLLGALLGHWLDLQLGTNPIFGVLGFLLGAATGAVADWRLITRFLARFDD